MEQEQTFDYVVRNKVKENNEKFRELVTFCINLLRENISNMLFHLVYTVCRVRTYLTRYFSLYIKLVR